MKDLQSILGVGTLLMMVFIIGINVFAQKEIETKADGRTVLKPLISFGSKKV